MYWKPVWHLLEEHLELVLANAQHIRNVPGRKTDVNDAAWIADLLAHGLIRSSFVPPAPIQALRDLTRTRKQLVREISQHSLRIQKTLEDANLKLGSVLSNVLGSSGRAILTALIGGQNDPERLADLAQGRHDANAQRSSRRCTGIRRALIVIEAGPFHAVQNLLDGLGGRALQIRILDPQYELAAVMSGKPMYEAPWNSKTWITILRFSSWVVIEVLPVRLRTASR